jgi:hypothetical protein
MRNRPEKHLAGRFLELKQCVTEYVHEMRNECFPITREVTGIKALELLGQMQMPMKFTASTARCDGLD